MRIDAKMIQIQSNNRSWKNNQNDQQLESDREIFLLKEAFCRMSKRLVLLENFLKYKFDKEFPPASSFDFVKVNANADIKKSSGIKKNGKKKLRQPKSNSTENNPHISSEAKPIDWENQDALDCADRNDKFGGQVVQPGPSLIRTDVVIDSKMETDLFDVDYDNSDCSSEHGPKDDDSDYECPDDTVASAQSEEDVVKVKDNKSLYEENSSDSESEYNPSQRGKSSPKKKIKSSPKKKSGRSISVLRKRGRGRPRLPDHAKKDRSNDRLTCEICEKVFLGSQAKCNLKSHMDSHSAERKYKCSMCDKAFRQRTPLYRHTQRVHRKDQFAVHLCRFCEKKFITKKELEYHEATHTGEKKHACEICGFQCVQAYNFKLHMDRHTKKNLWLCPECGKSFSSKHRLKEHTKNLHEGEFGPDGKKLKTFSCDVCPSVLINPLGLQIHMKKFHGIKVSIRGDSIVKSNSKGQEGPQLSQGENEMKSNSEEANEAVLSILPD